MTTVEHLNPEALMKSAAFTQAVAVSGPHKVVYVGGQNAVDAAKREIVGQGDLRAQTKQVFSNLRAALAAAGGGLEHVIKWNVYLVHGQDPRAAFDISQQEWDSGRPPPAVTTVIVAGLANPAFLIEIDAVAILPEPPALAFNSGEGR